MNFRSNSPNEITCKRKLPLASVRILIERGLDLKSIFLDAPGISNEEVIEIAKSEKRTILTFDKDYGELVFKYGHRPNNGVIYFRLKSFTPEQPIRNFNKII
ncbi:MAG: DUF5615 family PIN-like protein [bacterium]